jgi:hypothetical protein
VPQAPPKLLLFFQRQGLFFQRQGVAPTPAAAQSHPTSPPTTAAPVGRRHQWWHTITGQDRRLDDCIGVDGGAGSSRWGHSGGRTRCCRVDQVGRLLETPSVPTTLAGYRTLVALAGSLGTVQRLGIERAPVATAPGSPAGCAAEGSRCCSGAAQAPESAPSWKVRCD